MATPIDQIGQHELNPTLKALAKADGTTEHSDWIRSGKINAALLIQFINHQLELSEKNRFEMSVEQQLATLRCANDEEKWGIAEEVFDRLAATAPSWPKGKHAYRSLRIRFGEGGDGVAKTFEAHCARIQHVFGDGQYYRDQHLRSGKVEHKGEPVERLRLLNGNHTHKACVEWVVADLGIHRTRESINAVRDVNSLADELLVITWMFPDRIRNVYRDDLPSLYAAGYEANRPEGKAVKLWLHVVYVSFYDFTHSVQVCCSNDIGADNTFISLPGLVRKPQVLGV